MPKKILLLIGLLVLAGIILAACSTSTPQVGPAGAQGPAGPAGPPGPPGPPGPAGTGLTEEQAAALEAAGRLEGVSFPALEQVQRGCPACHALVDQETGAYTLPFEAHERAEARGGEHPSVAPDGTSLEPTEEVSVTVCLQCHAAGTGDRAGQGVIAPLSLRDIVHPAHMSSQFFKLHYGGSCFTCHNVNAEGGWDLLTEAVDVNEKGVPNPEALPIPGAVPIGTAGGAAGTTITGGAASRGGRLYDNWMAEAGVDVPASDQPIWASQTTNTRTGADTWRCKECHGWDYKGAEGAYGTGSHFTGFPGVFEASSKSAAELTDILTGAVNPDHDFSAMGDDALLDLTAFLRTGLVDYDQIVDAETKTAPDGDAAQGEELFAACAGCHGEDGRTLNFGSDDEPEYIGTLALDNPWEFLHKVWAGQPGTAMPAAMDGDWNLEDLAHLLAFSQTLPVEAP